jgi:hypothetical protein
VAPAAAARRRRASRGRTARLSAGGRFSLLKEDSSMTGIDPSNPLGSSQQMLAEMSKHWFNAYKTGLDMLLAISNAALAGAEHMRMMQLATDIETQNQNREVAAKVGGASDIQGVMKAQQMLSQSYLDGFMKYWSTTAQMVQQTQSEISKVLAAHMGDLGKGLEGVMPNMMAGLQPGQMPQMPQMPATFNAAIDAMRKSQESMMKAMSGFTAAATGGKK